MIDINLLPWREEQKQRYQMRCWLEILGAFVLGLVLLGLTHWVLLKQCEVTQARIQDLQKQLAAANLTLQGVQGWYEALDYQKPPALDLNSMLTHERQVLDLLKVITAKLPPEITLYQLQLDQSVWILQGKSNSLAAITRLEEDLKTQAAMKNEKYLKVQRELGRFSFQLSLEPAA